VAQDYNMDKPEKIFVDGMMFRNPNPQAPAFIKGDISVNVEKFKDFCVKNADYTSEKGWLNITLKESRGGAMYFELNTWKPEKKESDKDWGLPNNADLDATFGSNTGDIPFS
jgi:hypothetical protein